MMLVSLLILSILFIFVVISTFTTITIPVLLGAVMPKYLVSIASALGSACTIASAEIFEVSAIQFGTDQFLEASSTQISAFIH